MLKEQINEIILNALESKNISRNELAKESGLYRKSIQSAMHRCKLQNQKESAIKI
jgi:lambda repressor-like predicted transcriptional regulator